MRPLSVRELLLIHRALLNHVTHLRDLKLLPPAAANFVRVEADDASALARDLSEAIDDLEEAESQREHFEGLQAATEAGDAT